MEMVQTKVIISAALIAGLLSSCASRSFSWTCHDVDAGRTGVTAPNADNVPQALGQLTDSCYISPSGRVFPSSSCTYATARDLIAAQPAMKHLKQVIGYSTEEMRRGGVNTKLSNWIVDHLREDVEQITSRRCDVGLINKGGIRVDMPQGDVIMDDIVSMLPFRNHLCYVALKGKDLKLLFDTLAAGGMQPVSGVKVVVRDDRVESLLVGGESVDDDKVYGVATVDFLLDGGDRINVAKNALEVIITDKMVIDSMLPYAMSYAQEGKNIEYFTDDRIVFKKEDKQ